MVCVSQVVSKSHGALIFTLLLQVHYAGRGLASPAVPHMSSGKNQVVGDVQASRDTPNIHYMIYIYIYIYIWIDASKLLTPQKITDLILKKSLKSTQHAPKFISWVACHGLLIHGLHHELQELSVAIHGLPHLSDISAVVIQWGVRK